MTAEKTLEKIKTLFERDEAVEATHVLWGPDDADCWICPKCCKAWVRTFNFCPSCGQRWSNGQTMPIQKGAPSLIESIGYITPEGELVYWGDDGDE